MPNIAGRLPFFFILLLILSLCRVPALHSAQADPLVLQQQAIQRIDGFIDHFRKTGDQDSLRGELQQAESELTSSSTAFLSKGDRASAALSLIKLGDVQRMQSRWQEAVDVYHQAYAFAQQENHIAHQAKALMGRARAEIYGLRDYGAASQHIEQAVRLSVQLADKSSLFDALDYKAQTQISRGDLIAAADTLGRAFAVAEEVEEADEMEDQSLLFYGYLDRAEVYQKLAEKCDYQRIFEPCYQALELAQADYERALTLAQKLGYDGLAEQTKGFLQRLETRRFLIQSQEGFHKQLLQQAIFHPHKPSDVLVKEQFLAGTQHIPAEIFKLIQQEGGFAGAGDARSVYTQGLLHDMQGDTDTALAAYLKAVDLLETDRRNIQDEKSRAAFLEDKIEFYYTPIQHLLEQRRFAEAFTLLERSKSRAMADLLASKQLRLSGQSDQDLYAASLKVKTDIARLQTELFRLRSRADREKYTQEIATTEQHIQQREAAYQRLLSQTAKQAPRLRTLLVSQPVSLPQLQQSMQQDGYEVLAYLVIESQIIVWHISPTAIHVTSVFLPRSELINKVTALRQSLTDRNVTFDEQTARELFLFLIQPALEWINTEHLVIMPHEALNTIPFQVLQNPSDQSALGERFQISYAPSATILMGQEKAAHIADGQLLAVADPDITEAQAEVQAIAALYPEHSRAVSDVLVKESALKTWVGQYDLLHLSVHGRFSVSEPLLSYLQLREGDQEDGQLTAAEMFGLPLAKARLVVLSACETGQVEASHSNEILGMLRALRYAGANTLILSSWQVDAASTALWMETFYRAAQTKPLSEAAREALVRVKNTPQYQHPYYWGPFVMIGK